MLSVFAKLSLRRERLLPWRFKNGIQPVNHMLNAHKPVHHTKGITSQGRIGEALQELLLAEEAFELAPSKLLDGVDNIALLMLDIVW